ncbi:GntR family transcriptional regulator [Oerskovia sp. Root22]|uniref:GntR family transcriptional regulator n=1 Tax=Oerskovia sp. Root22 TaxID=1736494 RepID=UPI000AEC78EB|nr:GntR family transcriptional regulator [Oerskovia sp. Root22]
MAVLLGVAEREKEAVELSANPTMSVTIQPIAQRSSLGELAFKELLHKIVDGTLAPGERLEATSLAASIGISRTPLRGALNELAEMGFVVVRPKSSTRVAEWGIADMRDRLRVLRRALTDGRTIRPRVDVPFAPDEHFTVGEVLIFLRNAESILHREFGHAASHLARGVVLPLQYFFATGGWKKFMVDLKEAPFDLRLRRSSQFSDCTYQGSGYTHARSELLRIADILDLKLAVAQRLTGGGQATAIHGSVQS